MARALLVEQDKIFDVAEELLVGDAQGDALYACEVAQCSGVVHSDRSDALCVILEAGEADAATEGLREQ
eukprot:473967-Heterocapsa_arctica.AAC.1